MVDNSKGYKRSFDDELDWNLLDQLHKVVLQISTFCFRTKQICLTVEIAVIGLLIKFTDNKLDESVFIAGLIIPLCFWFVDSMAFFYQVKTRGIMDNIRYRLKKRNSNLMIDESMLNVIDTKRIDKNKFKNIINSFFNHSMWLYYILLITDITLWISFKEKIIQ
jgi:hypothetical protein